jgi:hypothetical protein
MSMSIAADRELARSLAEPQEAAAPAPPTLYQLTERMANDIRLIRNTVLWVMVGVPAILFTLYLVLVIVRETAN